MCKDHIENENNLGHSPHNNSREKETYWKVFCLGMNILIFQVIGGLISNGLSLLTDSAHVAVDMLNLTLSRVVAYLVEKSRADEIKIRWIGKIISVFLLWITLYHMAIDAIFRYENPEETTGILMFIFAVVGYLGNKKMENWLHETPENERNITSDMALLHVYADKISSAIVIVSSIVIWGTGCRIIDPIMSFLLCLFLTAVSIILLVFGRNKSCCHNHHH